MFDWWEHCQKWRTPESLAAISKFYATDYFDFANDFLVFGSGSYAGGKFSFAEFQIDDMVGPLLYTVGPDGTRQYRESGWWIPRKNGKSEIVSSVGLYELSCSHEKANVVLAGGTLEDTEIVFDCACYMVEHNQFLMERLKINRTKKTITNRSTYSTLIAVATNKHGKHGKNPSLVIGDEIHTWMYREMWTSLITGSDTRPQPLFMSITTSSDNDPEKLETELYEHAKRVFEDPGKYPRFQSQLYVADKRKDNWLDEKVWRAVNPGIDAGFKRIGGMRDMAEKAKSNARLKNDFCRLHLNMRLGAITRWIDMHDWADCKVGEPIEPGSWVVGGLDLASTTDIASWNIYNGRRFEWTFFIPEERINQLEDRDRVPYVVWVEQGLIIATPGNVIDYEVIEQKIMEDQETYDLKQVGYDKWNCEAMRQNLEKAGIEMLAVSQGMGGMSAASKEFERRLIGRDFDHGGNDVAEWMASNVEVFTDNNGNIRPVRPKRNAAGKKIDGIVSAIMSVAISMDNEPEGEPLAETLDAMFIEL